MTDRTPSAAGRTTVGEVGELALVAAVTERLAQASDVLVGPGDDAAIVATPTGSVVVTTDLVVENWHFRRAWSSASDVGRKAAARNLADVAAMGATPVALVVGLGLPPATECSWVLDLVDGIRDEAAVVPASVVGGDITAAEVVVVAVTALGELRDGPAITRSGARPGDVVAVCGRLGWAEAGRAVLARGFRSPRVVVAAHRVPEPAYDAGPEAARLAARALIDVSDGLLRDAGRVAAASSVTIDIRTDGLTPEQPLVDVGAALGVDPLAYVLTGGEDHALLGCFPPDAALPERWRVVGEVREGPAEVTVDGAPYEGPSGWEHFRTT